MTPVLSLAHWWSDFFYLAYRVIVILSLAILTGSLYQPKENPLSQTDVTRSESVTEQNFTHTPLSPADHAALAQKVVSKLRLLRLVLERIPKHFTPYRHVPAYKLTYYVEKLECGHTRFYFPQAGPPTKRRHCSTCAFLATLPEKKPAVSVSLPADQEKKQA